MKAIARKIVLAGVPEQVNIPIQLCLERGIFARYGIEVDYRIVAEGTGKMIDLLEESQADVAITVTDAFIVAKNKGRKIDLCGTYVSSPLTWAVAAGADAVTLSAHGDPLGHAFHSFMAKDKDGKLKFGISRMGSGSHTMAYYACLKHLQPVLKASDGPFAQAMDFVIANDFQGLREGVKSGVFHSFLWETFTTKPYFDSGELVKLGDVAAPWPAFSIVTSDSISSEVAMDIRTRLFPALHEGCDLFNNFTKGENISQESVNRIVKDFRHSEEDAARWLKGCRYAPSMAVDKAAISTAIDILAQAKLVTAADSSGNLFTVDSLTTSSSARNCIAYM